MYRGQGATGSKQPASKISALRVSKASAKPGASTGTKPKLKQPQKCAAKKAEGATRLPTHAYPAFSLPQVPLTSKEAEKAVQKIIRRNKPPGEDVKKLNDIVRSIGNRQLEVQEFVALVAPSTGDNAEGLLSVMNDELTVFQKITRKIYDTIGQDINDVLANEQIQFNRFTDERYALYLDKIHRIIYEVQCMCPDFDYDQYVANENYLQEKFPLEQAVVDAEAEEALMRQATYLRYQWLKSEGERLKEENVRLKKRLNQLKSQQRADMMAVVEKEEQTEYARQDLEEEQTVLEDKLQELNESVGKSLVQAEALDTEPISLAPLPPKPKDSKARKTSAPKPTWASQQAAEIESEKVSEALQAETSKLSIRAKTSMSRTKQKKGSLRRPATARKPPQDPTSPFHFSPVKTPPAAAESTSQRSPFHFSPIKSAPPAQSGRPTSPFHYSPIRSPQAAQPARETSPFHYSPIRSPQAAQPARPTSPFHYSPIRSPQAAQPARETSPFHYSPVRTPPAAQPALQTSPFHYSPPPRVPRTRSRTNAGATADASTSETQPRMRVTTSRVVTSRRCQQGPRDSWSGFN